MNHAVFWVTLMARCNSQELTPFLQFTTIQTATIHLSSPMGDSSKTVPVFTLNCLWHSRFMHFQIRRELRYETRLLSQCGQVTPFGQRISATKSRHALGSEK